MKGADQPHVPVSVFETKVRVFFYSETLLYYLKINGKSLNLTIIHITFLPGLGFVSGIGVCLGLSGIGFRFGSGIIGLFGIFGSVMISLAIILTF